MGEKGVVATPTPAPSCAPGAPSARSGERRAGEGLLSVVGTPIGNLSDMAPRALEALRSADAVLCEDTRVTARLASAFGLRLSLERCDENVIEARVPSLLGRLEAGEHLAFVSDAGMPAVSDPGQRLVDAALDAGLRVEVVPGPSAVTCALVASGLASEHFFFEGFLPRKPGAQRARLAELAAVPGTLVIYESPHRAAATLANVGAVLGERRVALCRELTKLHEEVLRGTALQLVDALASREPLRGECVLVVAPPDPRACAPDAGGVEAFEQDACAGLASGEPKSALAKRLAAAHGLSRSEAYDRILSLSRVDKG